MIFVLSLHQLNYTLIPFSSRIFSPNNNIKTKNDKEFLKFETAFTKILKKSFALRDHRQITFFTFNGFCPLNKKNPTSPKPVLKGQYQDGWNTNQNQIKIHAFYYIAFQVLKVLLVKSCNTRPQDKLFLFVLHISKYHSWQIFRTSFNIIWKKKKKNFVTNFVYLTDSINPPSHPPTP